MHLSAGELLREESATGSEEAKLIDNYIKEGKIVPVRITCALLKKAMRKHGWEVMNEKFTTLEARIPYRRISSKHGKL